MARLSADPQVTRFIGEGTPWSPERAADVAEHAAAHWREHGFGWRVATLAETGTAVGFIALSFAGADSGIGAHEYEIGWWLHPSAWGRGLAREGAAAVRNEAFTRLRAPGIAARVQPRNDASLAVATGIGMTRDDDATGRFGEPIAVLRLSADDWRRRARQDVRA